MEDFADEFLGAPDYQIVHPLNLIVVALFAILTFQLLGIVLLGLSKSNAQRGKALPSTTFEAPTKKE